MVRASGQLASGSSCLTANREIAVAAAAVVVVAVVGLTTAGTVDGGRRQEDRLETNPGRDQEIEFAIGPVIALDRRHRGAGRAPGPERHLLLNFALCGRSAWRI